MDLTVSPWILVGFLGGVIVMLVLDLGVFQKDPHEVSFKEAAIWSVVWISVACAFGVYVLLDQGHKAGLEFFTGYLIEKGLSVDNLFVILVIFKSFAVPKELRHRVLFWGVIGAVIMRGAFIAAGAVLVQKFEWVLYIFGGILILTAIRMVWRGTEERSDPSESAAIRFIQKHMPVTKDYDGKNFFVKRNGSRCATPLFLALVTVELTDVVFAFDSIPAIFGITRDFFIVFTSNILAILGLRALYFLLEGVLDRFKYLDYGLAAVLGLVGVKLLIEDLVHIPVWVSLVAVLGTLTLSMTISWFVQRSSAKASSGA